MDWIAIRERAVGFVKKYRYVVLVLAVGLFLMWLPPSEEAAEAVAEVQTETPSDPEAELEEILSQIDGAGKVKVLLTQATGEETIYQTDDDITVSDTSSTTKHDTVIVSDSGRTEGGLVRTVNPPTYLGAIVVCQGAERPSVCLAIVEAVSNATGLGTDRISVLKMK